MVAKKKVTAKKAVKKTAVAKKTAKKKAASTEKFAPEEKKFERFWGIRPNLSFFRPRVRDLFEVEATAGVSTYGVRISGTVLGCTAYVDFGSDLRGEAFLRVPGVTVGLCFGHLYWFDK